MKCAGYFAPEQKQHGSKRQQSLRVGAVELVSDLGRGAERPAAQSIGSEPRSRGRGLRRFPASGVKGNRETECLPESCIGHRETTRR